MINEGNVSFLNTNKYPFEKRVFVEEQQVLCKSEYSNGLSLNAYYEPDGSGCEHVILLLSGNSISFFNVEDVIINNSNENNHHTIVFVFESTDDMLSTQAADSDDETYRSCEFDISNYITIIKKTQHALIILCLETSDQAPLSESPDFPIILHCEGPTAINQLSSNADVKNVYVQILLNNHTAPFRYAQILNNEKEEFFGTIETFVSDLNNLTFGMGVCEGSFYLLGNWTSEHYTSDWKNGPLTVAQLKRMIINSDPNDETGDNCIISVEMEADGIPVSCDGVQLKGMWRVPLIDFLLDIQCLVVPGFTMICTPERSYMIDILGEKDVNIDIDPILFEVSEDEKEEELRNKKREFIFTDYLDKHMHSSDDNYIIGVMFDKDNNLICYCYGYAQPDVGSITPTDVR